MAELLKNRYNIRFFERFIRCMKEVYPLFNEEVFIRDLFDNEWENKELKQRMRHITHLLNDQLEGDYEQNVQLLLALIRALLYKGVVPDFEYMFLADFIQVYGLEHYEVSIKAMEEITKFVSCEFAIRHFIVKDQDRTLQKMREWSDHTNKHVRRLSSEGCRPRLPWSIALTSLKQNPICILPILENLKNDPSEYVRRSVANNLNDISKDNPHITIDIARKWIGKTKELDKLVKHGCRTLLKQGNQEVMALFGYGSSDDVEIKKLKILSPTIKIGDALSFSFELEHQGTRASIIRVEYGMYYQKANGTLSKKVFKISEKEYEASSSTQILRKQSFRLITTRKYHVGEHQVSIIINGVEKAKKRFELTA